MPAFIYWKVATLMAVAARIIRRKAATLVMRGGEVFCKKARKDSAGKKVLQQLYCYKQQYIEILNFSPLRRSGIFTAPQGQ